MKKIPKSDILSDLFSIHGNVNYKYLKKIFEKNKKCFNLWLKGIVQQVVVLGWVLCLVVTLRLPSNQQRSQIITAPGQEIVCFPSR